MTAPSRGIDLLLFHDGARNWLTRNFSFDSGPIHLYPPFALPVLAPLGMASFETLLLPFLLLNIAATIAIVELANRLWGAGWPLRTKLLLLAILLSWAPYRVTLRNGQISLLITAVLLGALLARKKKREYLAGLLLGLSLCKYPLTFPFFLYVLFKREWKVVAASVALPVVLTLIFALHLDVSIVDATTRYIETVGSAHALDTPGWSGSTEIKQVLLSFAGGSNVAALTLYGLLSAAGLAALALTVKRNPHFENLHFAALALFALWSAYHRTYDAVICVIPAALFVDFHLKQRHVLFSRVSLMALGLFAISLPGLLTERLRIDPATLSGNPFGWLGLHSERLLVFGMFWSLILMSKRLNSDDTNNLVSTSSQRRSTTRVPRD